MSFRDSSFATNGVLIEPLVSANAGLYGHSCNSLTILSDNKIIIAGYSKQSSTDLDKKFLWLDIILMVH